MPSNAEIFSDLQAAGMRPEGLTDSGRVETHRRLYGADDDPLAGLRLRRERRGEPVGRIVDQPLEWWQVIENQTAREGARLRREGRV